MAFSASGLTTPSFGVGKNRRHSYSTPDTTTTVGGANYFDSAWEKLSAGDVIECVCTTGGTPTAILKVVTASSSSAVTVANFT